MNKIATSKSKLIFASLFISIQMSNMKQLYFLKAVNLALIIDLVFFFVQCFWRNLGQWWPSSKERERKETITFYFKPSFFSQVSQAFKLIQSWSHNSSAYFYLLKVLNK
jgi:hypothetical protein